MATPWRWRYLAEPGLMAAGSGEQWARWWCEAWKGAHPSWQLRFAEQIGLPLPACERLARCRPEAFLSFAGVLPQQPPEPNANALHWLALEASQRQLALALVGRICAPGHAEHGPTDEHGPWCRSVAKALRPGLWLGEGGADARVLLGAWLGPHCWARLRLCWPAQPGGGGVEAAMAFSAQVHSRLQTLWPAVLWRVAAG
ncbi:type III secretion protein [Pseudomonas typographi]|uniref:type III secretion protein n=1 Tax=Pseudomonas typographi TaxID=2715964 RepID=UPI001EEDCA7B|nr:type III secretion protein [Pseudomonas typographi]